MKSTNWQILVLSFHFALYILFGCSKEDSLGTSQHKPIVIIETDKLVYAEVDTVFFEFFVVNENVCPVELSSQHQPVPDIFVSEGDGSWVVPPIWRWHPDSTHEAWSYELAPGETLNLGGNFLFWLQTNFNGNLVSRGRNWVI